MGISAPGEKGKAFGAAPNILGSALNIPNQSGQNTSVGGGMPTQMPSTMPSAMGGAGTGGGGNQWLQMLVQKLQQGGGMK